jgi:hypothetical protein
VLAVTFSAWFDVLSPAAKIGGVFLIVLAAVGAAAGFVSSVARIARIVARLLGRGRPHGGGSGEPDGT